MISQAGVWIIFFLPVAALAVNSLIVRPFFNHRPILASQIIIGALTAALVLSIWTLASVVKDGPLTFEGYTWLSVAGMDLSMSLIVDSLTAIMLVVVTGVSLMVQIYSHGYMKGDPGYVRYFAFMSMFSAAMIGLVIAGNIIQLYVMWELVGLGSYLLIGFWHDRPAAAAAAKKAFPGHSSRRLWLPPCHPLSFLQPWGLPGPRPQSSEHRGHSCRRSPDYRPEPLPPWAGWG